MAMKSVTVPAATTQEYLKTVQAIAHQAATCKDLELPHVLVRLYPIVNSADVSFKDLRKIKEHIWLSDLLHVLVEVLRQDFSVIPSGWDTARQLGLILESVCSGFHPSVKSGSKPEASEAVNEYYEILLPTVVDSMLILASNVLQAITEHKCKTTGYFENIIDSLLSICRHHKPCVQRVVRSPYLLHMLITDNTDMANVILTALGNLLNVDQHCLIELPPETLYSILDELVYKMSGSEEKCAALSLEIMALVSSSDVSVIELIVSRYTELLLIVRKWGVDHLGTIVKHFVKEVELRSVAETEVEHENRAAVVIQASWRGFSARRKMKRINNGIRRFQQFYRRWKASKERLRENDRKVEEICSTKHKAIKQGRLSFWEGQLSLVEQLPPADVTPFIEQQEIKAATTIQSYWRVYLAQKRYNKLREGKILTKNAILLQRTFRDFSQRKKQTSILNTQPLDRIEGSEREHLQQEITTFRERHEHSNKSESDKRMVHDKVQGLLEQFYLSRPSEGRKNEQRKIVLSQLERRLGILSSAPSLKESFGRKGIDETFSSGSTNVARMAQTAHKEELRCTDKPWWKLPSVAHD